MLVTQHEIPRCKWTWMVIILEEVKYTCSNTLKKKLSKNYKFKKELFKKNVKLSYIGHVKIIIHIIIRCLFNIPYI
jgi:hypothetical protein